MNSIPPDDPLPGALAEWQLRPAANPNFRPAVWRRIRQPGRDTWPAAVRRHAGAWSLAAIVMVGGGAWVGSAAGRASLAAKRDAMVVAYLVDLDPRVQARLRP